MEPFKLAVKFFVADPSGLQVERFVPVFHSWIQTHALPGHVLIDVADYKHVIEGPGIVLVSHEANISLDEEGNRPGLLYIRKQPPGAGGAFTDNLRAVFRAAAQAAVLLQDAPPPAGPLTFSTDEFLFRINDRLLAPNTVGTFDRLSPLLAGFLRPLFGPVELTHNASPGSLFEVAVKAPQAPNLATLLDRLNNAEK